MLDQNAEAKVDKLEAMTVARGASPAEAATAAFLARRLVRRIASRDASHHDEHAACRPMLAPGVHVDVVSRRGTHAAVRLPGCARRSDTRGRSRLNPLKSGRVSKYTR
jgi:hypothetical protein